MPFLPYVLCRTVIAWLTLAPALMLVRSLRGLLSSGEAASSFDYLLALTTEPLVMPARILMGESVSALPIDLPFLLTFILLPSLRGLLPAVTLA